MQGIIALDIDGTLTAERHTVDQEVISALNEHFLKGWKFIFITGRPFQWSYQTLKEIPFSYALAVQNGALLLKMPEQKILNRSYLDRSILPLLKEISQEEETHFAIYSGFENDDWCFYCPQQFPSAILSYALGRTKALGEKWQSLDNFSQLPVTDFASIKYFIKEEGAYRISQKLEKLGLHAPPNRDPYNPDYFVVQGTHSEATKGGVLKQFIELTGYRGPIIAAGDDHNDRSMLQMAHIKVVMSNAPAEILKIADIIAPPATQKGIIQGLDECMHYLSKGTL